MSLEFEFTADEIVRHGKVAQKDIQYIRTWLLCDKLPQITDEQIVLFLLACDNVLDKTKQTILAYFKYTKAGPKIFLNRDLNSTEMTQQITVVESCVIPRRTKDNYLIVLQRLRNFSHWNFNLEASMKYFFMTFTMGLKKGPPPAGVIVLFDMKGVGLLHLTKLRVGPLKLFFNLVQEGLPSKIKNIHVLNSVYFIDKLIAIIKPLMRKELYDAIVFHPSDLDMNKFFQGYVEAECVPSDYGGKLPLLKDLEDITLKELKQMTEWFDIEEKLRKDFQLKN